MICKETHGNEDQIMSQAPNHSLHDGKSSSPKTISSESSSFSGKRPFLRKKLFASKIIGSRILSGNTFLSLSVLTLPMHKVLVTDNTSPPCVESTAFNQSSQQI